MARPSKDRVRTSLFIARSAKTLVEQLADERGEQFSNVMRALLSIGYRHRDELPPVGKP
jgi:hypothetical protein